VEIAKAVSKNARILIMDEPTAPLALSEVDRLFETIDKLKRRGITIIYISHRIEELFAITDRVSVMRDGKYVTTLDTGATKRAELINLMVGRELKEQYPSRSSQPGGVALELSGLCGNGDSDISFSLRKGEILGVAGLVGSGRTELARLIYGADPIESGTIDIDGVKRKITSPTQAIKFGIGLIPEDRKQHGCIMGISVRENISLSCLRRLSRFAVIDGKKEKKLVAKFFDRLRIKAPSMDRPVENLSGGNQQKVVIAKTLANDSDILVFDEPTRGIDVGAKQEIYMLMNELAEQGHAILMISSEMEELIGMSDRIIVMNEGRLTGELGRPEFSQEAIMELASVSRDTGASNAIGA
jgi:ribose transport system ATP-binding protein